MSPSRRRGRSVRASAGFVVRSVFPQRSTQATEEWLPTPSRAPAPTVCAVVRAAFSLGGFPDALLLLLLIW